MDTALPQKFPFILDRNLAKANCTENHVCTSCDKVVLDLNQITIFYHNFLLSSNHPVEGPPKKAKVSTQTNSSSVATKSYASVAALAPKPSPVNQQVC